MGGQLEGLESATIMMVDDEPTTIEVLTALLEGEGYSQFVTTSDSRQALGLLAAEKPDVLLLDLMMPHVGGLEILESIRNDHALEHTPVIILSSTDAETKLKALELGATDFLGKPVDPSELALRLRNTLAAKAHLDRLVYHDSVTGLANRRSLIEQLDRILDRAMRESRECGVLRIELDRFKQINDTLGHAVGDELLRAVAERLQGCVRPGDFLARIGGDEFVLLLPGLNSAERAARVAQRVSFKMEPAFAVGGQDLFVASRIGIALSPADGRDGETLLGNAGAAVSDAQQGELSVFRFYSSSLNAQSADRLNLENQLRTALAREEILLHYQPKVEFRTGRVVGAESGLRPGSRIRMRGSSRETPHEVTQLQDLLASASCP